MLAAVLPGVGQPLAIERIPVPQPRRGEVLVRVAACGVCHTDLHVLKGEVAFPVPAVLGHEISGTVAAPGIASAQIAACSTGISRSASPQTTSAGIVTRCSHRSSFGS